MLSSRPTVFVSHEVKRRWPGIPLTALRFLIGGETSGRDNAAWDAASYINAAHVPIEQARTFMESLWRTFDQPSDDLYPLEFALEKLDRLYGVGGGGVSGGSRTRRHGRPTKDRDFRHMEFRTSSDPLVWPEDIWHNGEHSIGRVQRLWDAGIAAMPQGIGHAKGGSSQNPKFKHLFGGIPTEHDWQKWSKVKQWREGNTAIILGHSKNPIYVIEVEQGDRDFDRVRPFLQETIVVRSSKSYHIYLTAPLEPSRGGFYSSKDPDFPKSARFEFKGNGQYVLSAGSLHPSGAVYHRVDEAGDQILHVENLDGFLNTHFPEFFDDTAAAIAAEEESQSQEQTVEVLYEAGIEEQMSAIENLTARGAKAYNALAPLERPSWWAKKAEDMSGEEMSAWEEYNHRLDNNLSLDIPRNELSQLRKSEYYPIRKLHNSFNKLKFESVKNVEKYTLSGQGIFLSTPLLVPLPHWAVSTAEVRRLYLTALGEAKAEKYVTKLDECGRRITGTCGEHGDVMDSHRRCRLPEHWMCLSQTALAVRQIVLPKPFGKAKYRSTWLSVFTGWVRDPMYRDKDVKEAIDSAMKVLNVAIRRKKFPPGTLLNRALAVRLGRDGVELHIRLLTLEYNECAGIVDWLTEQLVSKLGAVVFGQSPDHENQELATLQWMQDASESFGGFIEDDLSEDERTNLFVAYWYGTRRRHMTQAYEHYKLILRREAKHKDPAKCPACNAKLTWRLVDESHRPVDLAELGFQPPPGPD